jgi:hypothetical protein
MNKAVMGVAATTVLSALACATGEPVLIGMGLVTAAVTIYTVGEVAKREPPRTSSWCTPARYRPLTAAQQKANETYVQQFNEWREQKRIAALPPLPPLEVGIYSPEWTALVTKKSTKQ